MGLLALDAVTGKNLVKILTKTPPQWTDFVYPKLFSALKKSELNGYIREAFPAAQFSDKDLKLIRNFVKMFLRLNPVLRPTASQALNHEFLGQGQYIAIKDDIWQKQEKSFRLELMVSAYNRRMEAMEARSRQTNIVEHASSSEEYDFTVLSVDDICPESSEEVRRTDESSREPDLDTSSAFFAKAKTSLKSNAEPAAEMKADDPEVPPVSSETIADEKKSDSSATVGLDNKGKYDLEGCLMVSDTNFQKSEDDPKDVERNGDIKCQNHCEKQVHHEKCADNKTIKNDDDQIKYENDSQMIMHDERLPRSETTNEGDKIEAVKYWQMHDKKHPDIKSNKEEDEQMSVNNCQMHDGKCHDNELVEPEDDQIKHDHHSETEIHNEKRPDDEEDIETDKNEINVENDSQTETQSGKGVIVCSSHWQ